MEQKDKTFSKRLSIWVILALLILVNLGDITTTLLTRYKHKAIFNKLEVQPLFILGIPLWILIMVKLLCMAYIIYFFILCYHNHNIYSRFLIVNGLIFLILIFGALTIINFKAYRLPTEEIIPYPEEQRKDGYNRMVYDMEAIETVQPVKFKIPKIVSLLLWNMLIFIVWVDFEKGFIWKG